MSTPEKAVAFVIYGEPASKANSRKLVHNRNSGKVMFIKSQKARMYVDDFALQCPQLDPPLEGDLAVTITIYYASRRPDLDESVILDAMQSVVKTDKKTKQKMVLRNNIYLNDRQVKQKHIFWALDKEKPRAEIRVEPLDC
jgi:Holliday junction resolvase RusA-like endonuclease